MNILQDLSWRERRSFWDHEHHNQVNHDWEREEEDGPNRKDQPNHGWINANIFSQASAQTAKHAISAGTI
jgi:hypothetical protein